MKSKLLLFITLLASLFFHQCAVNKAVKSDNSKSYPVTKFSESKGEKQDGIKEAQEMEFQLTKDNTLGYVPRFRLIQAVNDLQIARKNGSYSNLIGALSWTERGPYLDLKGPGGNGRGNIGNPTLSGRIRSIWVDLKDVSNHTVWIGSASGGLWKTTNVAAGPPATWTAVNDFLGNQAIMTICQDPRGTKDVMYLGTGEKTFNSGAVRGGGIWKSTDNGANWALLANTAGFNKVSKIVCDAAGNVYAGTIDGGGLYRSTDGGNNWTDITPNGLTDRIIDMNLSSTGRLHVAIGYYSSAASSGYRYTDNPATVTGATWSAPVTLYSPLGYNVALASNGNTLYATCDNGAGHTEQVWKSTDGGANWAATPTTPPITGPAPVSSTQAWYCQAIAVDPSNANNVMVGGLNTYISNDGGATWTINSGWVTGIPGTANYIHADHQTFVWSTGNEILCGGDGGLSYSINGGSTFDDRNEGLRIKQFYAGAIHPNLPNYFLAGAQDNGVHQLNGPGLASSLEVIGGDGGFVHIDENESQYQFGAYTNAQYRRSTNGGSSWSNHNFSASAGLFINPTDYDDMNNNFYGSWDANFYTCWTNAPASGNHTEFNLSELGGSKVTHVAVSRYATNRIFLGSANGTILKVESANTSPTATAIKGTGMPASNVSCIATGTTDNNLLATFSNYGAAHVWASTTGGGAAGWTNITGDLPDIPVRWAMFNPEDNTKAILATEAGIFETSLINGASTIWVQNAGFPTVRTDMFQYRYSDNTILAASYGRGLWTSTFTPAVPHIRFASSYTYSPENIEATTATIAGCRNYKDYTLNMHIDKAPAGAATVTLSIAGGPTATQGIDFEYTTNGNFAAPSNVLTFPNGGTADQPITIRVYDDAEIESAESFIFNYVVSGATDAVAAPSSPSYTFNIADNDAAPVVSTYNGSFTPGSGFSNIINESPFRGGEVKQRMQALYKASELNAAGITGAGRITSMKINIWIKQSGAQPYNGFTISLGNTTATNMNSGFASTSLTQVYSGNYVTVAGDNTFAFSTPFLWDGTSNIVVNYCWDNGATTTALDAVVGEANPFGAGNRATCFANSGDPGAGCSLSGAFVYDGRIKATFDASDGNSIETVLNNNRSEYVANNGTYHFYNGNNIISRINSASANLGCVGANIFEAGTTWSAFEAGQRSQKVIEITPTTNTGASYTVSLYYTLAELGGIMPANIKIAKTNAATMAAANATNTATAPTTFTAFGTGYLFTASFTGFSKFFLINENVVLPVTLVSFSGHLNSQQHSELQWRATNQLNFNYYELQRSYDAVQFAPMGTVPAVQNNGGNQDYSFTDPLLAKAENFYRLKMVDLDGKFKLSDVIRISNNKIQKFAELVQNPVQNQISLLINNTGKDDVTVELFNQAGQLINKMNLGKADGKIVLPFKTSFMASGTYMLRVTAGDKSENLKLTKL